jgi:hypothetical protein
LYGKPEGTGDFLTSLWLWHDLRFVFSKAAKTGAALSCAGLFSKRLRACFLAYQEKNRHSWLVQVVTVSPALLCASTLHLLFPKNFLFSLDICRPLRYTSI